MERIKMRLVVDLKFEAVREIETQVLRENLEGMLRSAYANGVFTEDTEAGVYGWGFEIQEDI